METKLARIASMAKSDPNLRFTSIGHLINEEALIACHRKMKPGKATGVDGITKEMYERELGANVKNLVDRLKKKSYRPLPARRTYIPKDEKSRRPLGIPAYEDKLVQMALKRLLEAIYEQDFLENSYGFRPGRSMHDALKRVTYNMERGKMEHVVDADISGFFNHVNHEWLMKFLDKRIGDPNIHRLVKRMLIAGIQENGVFESSEEGTPQGSAVSPLLANIYLHYVLDLWFDAAVKKQLRGRAEMVRFADDFVCMFQFKDDAERFYYALLKRLARFNLTVAEEKTKIIRFGRFAEAARRKAGLGKPDTFDFLGFTHYCGKSRTGGFRVKRKTSKKKFRQKIKAFDAWMKQARHKELSLTIPKIRAKLIGHFRYYGITDNFESIRTYSYLVQKSMFKWLNRRSQRQSYSKEKFYDLVKRWNLPKPRIYVNIYD
ncbi:group II intron reverse transcriptase/maturase [Paenibacillus thiaminolyticus]|uniref:group II intron reverse transcriptase/maturase n=1 Tax=Paenibacillus thiaminolyticus TaxID=49283 RepID=UPI00232FAB0B|nr:group II intron reverse transcriptase/maturase [Paenibacillus thiaminolyticus]WCF08372.1 group II intron reverse transcriptase/maturase [Paenibacillus thiaminolyticus]WCF08669.1 group II intron reverse transcriptase/maturase [Paenibacillus thiaminolyticus]WCF10859.1 group II intron reverse transcriptase/maturase [Paenibacillus thiaminolyticus]